MQLSETINRNVSLHMGADISIIKAGQLEDDAEIMRDTERVTTGISEEPATTIGLINLNLK